MKTLIPVLAVLAVLISLAACDVEDTYSVRERMKAFIDDANAESWNDLKAHTHPDSENYQQADADFWETRLSVSVPLDDLTVSGQTATVTGADDVTFTFYLTADSSDDNLIIRIERGPDTIFE
ncbi:MAG: hypothetical protein BWY20_01502 [Spirochaetes bacterium ADurb.Bin215]|nr:MAG: hypothetical protein BWY20_01502 [Spirochaetes bacterium ADurb.Bin215]